ncbi:hypothetical protein CDL12_10408 [Handroanthus impetiginosus]|uniref:Retrotransposon gag domain-containing protein n=1 Tax=Handroanthus impetiginosus TaxID=429701 RepID=A0A2G9HHG9_9LAMI|nr:hypothetical protein CDL12_10408 [Handroanthus impetiginosus]
MKQDIAICYELKTKIFSTKQGNLSVTDYYGLLNRIWNELNLYQNLKMECNKDDATLTSFVERDQIFELLSGLNSEYDPIRVQILGKEKLPSLSEVFYIVRREESHRSVMLDEKQADGLALMMSKSSKNHPSNAIKSGKDNRWCSYCKKLGHIKENCFKLHGKEQFLNRTGGFKGIQRSQANLTSPNTCEVPKCGIDTQPFNKEELERLRSFFDSFSKNGSTCSLALNGSWIVDTGATDHKTFCPSNFLTPLYT